MDFKTILTSTVIAAIVALMGTIITATITKHNSDRNNELKYITQERKQWRRYLRYEIPKLLSKEYEKELQSIVHRLELNLNPYDIDDINILILARAIANKGTCVKIIKNKSLENVKYEKIENQDIEYQFMERVSRLLKSDWERSKLEASKPRFVFGHKNKITMLGSLISSCILCVALICVACNIYMTYRLSLLELFKIEGIDHLIENTVVMIIFAIIIFVILSIISYIIRNVKLCIIKFEEIDMRDPLKKTIDLRRKNILKSRNNKIDIKTKTNLIKNLDKQNVSQKENEFINTIKKYELIKIIKKLIKKSIKN